MKKGLLIVLAMLAIVVILSIVSYNGLVTAQTAVEARQADIMTQLQRRMDLIPNLISTANNYAAHETAVFAAVTEAREEMLRAKTMPALAKADDEMNAALTQLVAVAEAYPTLNSDKVFVGLMDELAGTENRIAVARKDYNTAVGDYNLAIRRFPGAFFAKQFGFAAAEYFEATEAAQTIVPAVS